MSCFDVVQKKLDSCLQRDVEIRIGKKTIRRGSFILYTIKDYFLTVILKTPITNKTYDILYPFDVQISEDEILFNYNIDRLASDHKLDSMKKIEGVTSDSTHKFFNKQLVMHFK